MKLSDYLFEVAPKALPYELARRGLMRPPNPLTITYSVTAACRSLCKTCNIGRFYLDNPDLAKQDLSLAEIEKVFESLGHIYFFNVSGGEPFMRMDLAEIARLAFIRLTPRLISIPTNALAPRAIETTTRQILAYMEKHLPSSVPLSIKPSLDGVGAMHDYIRGVPGNFVKFEETVDRLLALRAKHPRLHVDIGTVISNFNLHHLKELENWVHARGIESYRHEIAEQRVEFHNIGEPITPPPEVYAQLTREFAAKIVANIKTKNLHTRVTEAVRLAYYHVAIRILQQRRQVTPCYGGLANIHLDYNGEMWPCCVLGGEQTMGNVRAWEYDAQRLLASAQAKAVIRYIAAGNCACPLASQWLNNVLLTPRHLLRAAYFLFVRFPLTPRPPELAPSAPPVRPADVKVPPPAAAPQAALVVHQAGTIPAPEQVNLAAFASRDHQIASPSAARAAAPKASHHVHHVRPLTASTYVLRIDRQGVNVIPGQYAVLGKQGSATAREYTIYSATTDDFLEFLITQVPGGAVSNALRTCAPGEDVTFDGPMGYFRFAEQERATAKHCFIATGSGIAPFHAVVRSYPELDYTLLHGVRAAADCYDRADYAPERYIACVSREAGGAFQGRVTEYLRQHPVAPGTRCYICGNCAMIYEMYEILIQQGIPRDQIRTEVFY